MHVVPRLGLQIGLALVALLEVAAPSVARDAPRDFYGTVLDGGVLTAAPDVLSAQWPRMAASGVETARVAFSWAAAQPVEDGPVDFSHTDALVAGATAHGIDLLPVVLYAPAWARRDPALFNSPPANAVGYTTYLRALVARYGPRGSFWAEHPELSRRPVRAWQVWNEPQLRYQWNAPGFATGYGALLRASYRALKAADPGCTVVLAGATNLSWKVIEQLYDRGRIHRSFDVAAVHPYTATPAHVVRIVQLVRRVLPRHGDARVPIWVTELGFPASKGRSRSNNTLQTTPRGASQRLARSYDLLIRRRRDPSVLVSRVYWYTWASSYRGDIFNFTGLWRYDGASFVPQPQLAAYRRSARLHEGCVKTTAGVCR
jgi:hypothetical protein